MKVIKIQQSSTGSGKTCTKVRELDGSKNYVYYGYNDLKKKVKRK